MNLLIKSTTIFATILAATSGVNAGCTDPDGPGQMMGAMNQLNIIPRTSVNNLPSTIV